MIIKFLSGGTAPFVSYTPLNLNTASNYGSSSEEKSSRKSSSDSKESGELTEKDLLMAIKDLDALPSDSKMLYDELTRFVRLLEMYGDDIDTSLLATLFIRSQQHMKDAVFRKKAFEEAYNNVKENNGLNEYAVTDTGAIAVATEDGGIKFVPLSELNNENYKPLTNNDLLRLRAESYAYNDNLTLVVSNGIGLPTIQKLIKEAMISLGKDLIVSGENQNGILYLQQLIDNGILLSELEGNKVLSESQTRQAIHALNYIQSILPTNAKTILQIHASRLIKPDGTPLTNTELIYELIQASTSEKNSITNTQGKKSGTSDSGSDKTGEDTKTNQYTNIVRGRGAGTSGTFTLMDSDGFTTTVKGKSYPYILDLDGNNIPTSTLAIALLKGVGSMTMGAEYAITFGNQILTPSDMHKVLFEADGSTMRIMLPTKTVGGKIVPDIDFAKNHKELINAINDYGVNDPRTLKLFELAGYKNGSYDKSKLQTYLVANGKSDSLTVVVNEWVHQIDATDSERMIYQKYVKDDIPDFELDDYLVWNPFDWGGNYDKLYEGTIFIPISPDILLAQTGMKKEIKINSGDELERRNLMWELERYGSINRPENPEDRLNGK